MDRKTVIIKPCPFCGSVPVVGNVDKHRGTCFYVECENCCISCVDIQISDVMTNEEFTAKDSWNNETCRWKTEYIIRARNEAVRLWNERVKE